MARRGDVFFFGFHSGEIVVGDRVRGWKGRGIAVTSLDFTLDGRLLSGSADGAVKLWDAESGENLWARDLGVGKILCVAALADGRLAAAGNDGSVRVLDGATGRENMVCRGHEEYVTSIVSLQSDDDALFCSGSYDGTIRVWASDGAVIRVVEVGVVVWALSRSSCSRFVAAGCDETGLVNLFRLPDWNPVWSAKAHDGIVAAVSWSPDDRFLATASFDGEVKIISAETV